MATTMKAAVPAVEPSEQILRRNTRLLRIAGWIARLAMRRWFANVEVAGREHLTGGPLLLVMNHSHVFDPLVLSLYAGRPLQFMVTEPAMAARPLANVLAWLGQVPKRKLESDLRCLRILKKWCSVGGAVCVFPDGAFSWDGDPLPLQPGLQHLVHHLDVPVVTVRQINGDRVWPAWATKGRSTTVRLEFDPPIRFSPADDVEQCIAERLHVDRDTCPRWPVLGRNLAAGLARLLVVCPTCGGEGSLVDAGNELACELCPAIWAVGGDNYLRGQRDQLDIASALKKVYAHLRRTWKGTPSLESRGRVEVFDASRADWRRLGSGQLILRECSLSVGSWRIDLEDVLAHTLDWGELVLLRTQRQRIAIRMPHDSRAIWEFAFDEAQRTRREET